MRAWCQCLLVLQLSCAVLPMDQQTGRVLLCECTTSHCKKTNISTCHSQYKCYTQYLDKKDGSYPVTRGCVQGSTPILCENRRPEVRKQLPWPYLKCCDSGDLCNSEVMSTPPAWVAGGSSVRRAGGNETEQSSNATSASSSISDVGSSLLAFWVRQRNDYWPIHKPVIVAVMLVGLFLVISVMVFGFYILKIQSDHLRQLRRRYVRATKEESVPATNVTEPPLYHMTIIPPNPKQNNNLKSVETQ